jgi:hypothetical protein
VNQVKIAIGQKLPKPFPDGWVPITPTKWVRHCVQVEVQPVDGDPIVVILGADRFRAVSIIDGLDTHNFCLVTLVDEPPGQTIGILFGPGHVVRREMMRSYQHPQHVVLRSTILPG